MNPKIKKALFFFFGIAVVAILLDQVSKIICYNELRGFQYGGDGPGTYTLVGDWLKFTYVLNPGMAFGIEWGELKPLLTILRLVASFFIGRYLFRLITKESPRGLQWAIALILGGAIGNVIDGAIYGAVLPGNPLADGGNESPLSPWFYGQVIDMIYFDIYDGPLPEWVPIWGGSEIFIWPVFNIADSCIFIGVLMIIFGQKKYFPKEEEEAKEVDDDTESPSEDAMPNEDEKEEERTAERPPISEEPLSEDNNETTL